MRIVLSKKGKYAMAVQGTGLFVAAVVVGCLIQPGRGVAQPQPEKPLYQRMGGYDVIAGIVDDFIGQLRTDPAFARFGGGRSMDSLKRTRQLVVDQICNLTGGPCIYIGRDMKAAHAGLKITQAEWDSSIDKFKNSLNKFKIGEQEQQEFLDVLAKLRTDIVEPPQAEKPKQ